VGAEDRQTQVPEEMLTLLKFIERPHSPDYLKAALRVLVDRQVLPPRISMPWPMRRSSFSIPARWTPPETEAARKPDDIA
jgi:DNA helicase-2/ATP-dependent DNA helicase PcrA